MTTPTVVTTHALGVTVIAEANLIAAAHDNSEAWIDRAISAAVTDMNAVIATLTPTHLQLTSAQQHELLLDISTIDHAFSKVHINDPLGGDVHLEPLFSNNVHMYIADVEVVGQLNVHDCDHGGPAY
jgi:hypothetical protein